MLREVLPLPFSSSLRHHSATSRELHTPLEREVHGNYLLRVEVNLSFSSSSSITKPIVMLRFFPRFPPRVYVTPRTYL